MELKRAKGIQIGKSLPLCGFLGLNVLEDEALALETAKELKRICEKLEMPFVFKASFDKANRSSINSYRGPGIDAGIKIFEKVKGELNLPLITDVHELGQSNRLASLIDVLQIPAFLCRQTDLVMEAAKAMQETAGWLHVKKAQFLAPWDCKNIVSKVKECTDGAEDLLILCERGTSFGYNNLVVDMLAIQEMQNLGVPVTIDATHATQLPGSGKGVAGQGTASGGRRWGVEKIALASVAAGADGLFLEFHPNPDKAKCDPQCCLPLSDAESLLARLQQIHTII